LGSILYPIITVTGLFSVLVMYLLYLATIVYYIADQTQLIPAQRVEQIDVVDLDEDATSSE
jgi:hypothetical protein